METGLRPVAVPASSRTTLSRGHDAVNRAVAGCESFAAALRHFSTGSEPVHSALPLRASPAPGASSRCLRRPLRGNNQPHGARHPFPPLRLAQTALPLWPRAARMWPRAARTPRAGLWLQPAAQRASGDGGPFRVSRVARPARGADRDEAAAQPRTPEREAGRGRPAHGALSERRLAIFWMRWFEGGNTSRCPPVYQHAKGFA